METRIIRACHFESPVKDMTLYNISHPIPGTRWLLGRLERRDDELESQVVLLEEKHGRVVLLERLGFGQDPFHATVAGRFIIGNVAVHHSAQGIRYWTQMREWGHTPFFEGPLGMKDIRVIDYGKEVGIFTRPQGTVGGRGRIGYCSVSHEQFFSGKIPDLMQAPLFDHHTDEQWSGANSVQLLEDGKVLVLSHLAMYEGKQRVYSPTVFLFDPQSMRYSPLHVLFTPAQLKQHLKDAGMQWPDPKRADLNQVVFMGGAHISAQMQRTDRWLVDLYVGVGDVSAMKVTVEMPRIRNMPLQLLQTVPARTGKYAV